MDWPGSESLKKSRIRTAPCGRGSATDVNATLAYGGEFGYQQIAPALVYLSYQNVPLVGREGKRRVGGYRRVRKRGEF